MDPSNPDDWRKLATAFTSAPIWAVMVATGAPVGVAVWWFRGWMSQERLAVLREQIATVKEQVAAVEQQLKLATDASAASERAKDELEKQFLAYKSEVAAKGRDASPVKVDAAIVKVASGNTVIRSKLVNALMEANKLGRGMIKPD
jgi:hypothetical protein